MTEHLTEPEIELYRRRKSEKAAGPQIAAHLAVCEHCVNRVYDARHAALAINTITEAFLTSMDEEPFHLLHADLVKYVAGKASEADRIICESHLEVCEQCEEEVRATSAARAAAGSGARTFSPASLAWLSGWRTNTPLRLTAAIALIGLLAFGVLLMRRRASVPIMAPLAGNGAQDTPGVSVPLDRSNVQQSIVVQLKDNGKDIGLDQQGRVVGLDELDESTKRIVKTALSGETLTTPRVLDELSSRPIELLGDRPDENTFQLVNPLGKIITEARPTLSWKRLNGATSYAASIFDSKFNLILKSPPLTESRWTVAVPLQRGQNYFWEVTAVKEGKEVVMPVAPAARAQFRILERDQLNTLQNLKRQKPTSHLALGVTYARFGMVKEAEAEFRALLKENPDSAVAKKLLRTVQGWTK